MMSFNARFWKVLLLAGAAAAVTSCVEGDREGGDGTEFVPRSELEDPAGTVNDLTNPVDWSQLKSVPLGLADGGDYAGGRDEQAGWFRR